MSNYPPGVTGNEFAIAGPEQEWEAASPGPCSSCGHLDDDLVIFQAHRSEGAWWFCPNCDHSNDVSLDYFEDLDAEAKAEAADRRRDDGEYDIHGRLC